jgi:hypothetical protein
MHDGVEPVTYRPRNRTVPYKTRLTGWLISENEGFGANTPDPSPFLWPIIIEFFKFVDARHPIVEITKQKAEPNSKLFKNLARNRSREPENQNCETRLVGVRRPPLSDFSVARLKFRAIHILKVLHVTLSIPYVGPTYVKAKRRLVVDRPELDRTGWTVKL